MDDHGILRGLLAAGVVACAVLFTVGFVSPALPSLVASIFPGNATAPGEEPLR